MCTFLHDDGSMPSVFGEFEGFSIVIPVIVRLSVNAGIIVQNGGLEKLTPSISTFLHS